MVKQGFKQTEIGVIPEDWEVKELVDMVELINGRAYSQNELLSRGKYRVLRVGNFFSSDKWYWSDLELANKFYVENGDLMYAWSASFGPKFWLEEKTIYHYHIWKIDNYRKTDKKFLYHLLVNDKASIQNESQGGTMFHITKEAMEKRKFALPPLAEQEAIASALSDADAWIERLEQLIAKKRLIKQGAMQELLTPPSHAEPVEAWEVKKLGEVSSSYSGGTPNTANDEYYNGEINFIGSGDLNQSIIRNVEGKISALGLNNSSAKMIEPDTLLIAMYGATAGVVAISKISGAINQAILAVLPIKGYSTEYIYYFFALKKEWIIKTYTQGGQPNLSGGILKNIEIPFPSLSEQTRIAMILSDMDAELEALEQKLSKARQIKQGMMQELLTGRVRLV